MGYQYRITTLAILALFAVGCEASVELEPTPVTPAVSADQTAEAKTKPERVPVDEPVRSGDRPGGYFGAIAGARRSAVERIEAIQFKQPIDLYYASNGKYPKSHEEFMEKVWKPLKTPLPEIEEGYEYQYDPEDHSVYKVPINSADDGTKD